MKKLINDQGCHCVGLCCKRKDEHGEKRDKI